MEEKGSNGGERTLMEGGGGSKASGGGVKDTGGGEETRGGGEAVRGGGTEEAVESRGRTEEEAGERGMDCIFGRVCR